MIDLRRPAILAGAAGLFGLVALVHRHRRVPSPRSLTGRSVPGGVVMGDVHGYDRLSRLFFRSFFRGIAGNVAATVRPPARVLDAGCGPGWLSIELAGRGFEVTGLDLDPAMIERARANAGRDGASARPTFTVGDVAALPFPDAAFDLVVSTFSMHHWADRDAGLADIWRVVRPGGRILIWDLRPGAFPFHGKSRRPADDAHPEAADGHGNAAPAPDGPMVGATTTPWRWPFRLTLADRIELVRSPGARAGAPEVGAVVGIDASR